MEIINLRLQDTYGAIKCYTKDVCCIRRKMYLKRNLKDQLKRLQTALLDICSATQQLIADVKLTNEEHFIIDRYYFVLYERCGIYKTKNIGV
jgi:hypothetical protein